MQFLSRVALTLGLGFGLALLAGGCGGSDDEASDDVQATASSGASTSAPDNSATGTQSTAAPANDGPAGTGAPGASSDGGDMAHACALLTPAEVNEIFGGDVDAAEGRDYLATAAQATQCEWELQGGALYVEVLGSGASAWFDAVNFGNTNPPIEGIGDKAIIGPGGTLDVLQGEYMVSVQVVLFGSDIDREAVAREVAETVLGKLP